MLLTVLVERIIQLPGRVFEIVGFWQISLVNPPLQESWSIDRIRYLFFSPRGLSPARQRLGGRKFDKKRFQPPSSIANFQNGFDIIS
jgi:hypothetical protein